MVIPGRNLGEVKVKFFALVGDGSERKDRVHIDEISRTGSLPRSMFMTATLEKAKRYAVLNHANEARYLKHDVVLAVWQSPHLEYYVFDAESRKWNR